MLPHITNTEENGRQGVADESRLAVQMSQVAVDQIAGQATAAGILLGTITRAEQTLVRIESVQNVEAFTAAAFAQAARKIPSNSPLSALGYYRIDSRPGLRPEPDDLDIAARYFQEPEDLILLIYSEEPWMQGQFFTCGRADEWIALGRPFALRHRLAAFEPLEHPAIRRWTAVAVIAALAGLGAALVVRSTPPSQSNAAPASRSQEVKPLDLNVQATGQKWLVWWNAASSAAPGTAVRLFVHENGLLTRLDLSPQDLQSGTYEYRSNSSELTFRLELSRPGGGVSAESFRLFRTEAVPAASGGMQRAPRILHKVEPVIPPGIRARSNGSISIDVRVRVDERGHVTEATPVSKPQSGLEAFLVESAVTAVRQWEFEPARQDGLAVQGTQTIHFEL